MSSGPAAELPAGGPAIKKGCPRSREQPFAKLKKRRANGSPLDTSRFKKKLRKNRSLVLSLGIFVPPRTFCSSSSLLNCRDYGIVVTICQHRLMDFYEKIAEKSPPLQVFYL
jgi:hypothetical protein